MKIISFPPSNTPAIKPREYCHNYRLASSTTERVDLSTFNKFDDITTKWRLVRPTIDNYAYERSIASSSSTALSILSRPRSKAIRRPSVQARLSILRSNLHARHGVRASSNAHQAAWSIRLMRTTTSFCRQQRRTVARFHYTRERFSPASSSPSPSSSFIVDSNAEVFGRSRIAQPGHRILRELCTGIRERVSRGSIIAAPRLFSWCRCCSDCVVFLAFARRTIDKARVYETFRGPRTNSRR